MGRTGRGGTKINALKCVAEAMEVSGEPAAWASCPPPPRPGAAPTTRPGRAAAFEAPGSHRDSPSTAKAAPNGLDAPSQNFPAVPRAVGTQHCPSAPGRWQLPWKGKTNIQRGLCSYPRYGWPFTAKVQA